MLTDVLSFKDKRIIAEKMRRSKRYVPLESFEFKAHDFIESSLSIPTSVGDAMAYLISAPALEGQVPLIINLHGGGFIVQRKDRDRLFSSKLATALKCKVLDLDYKLAPEYMFPTALVESYEVLKWAYSNADKLGVDKQLISIIGHSSGGNLAVGVAVKDLECGGDMVNRIVIDYAPLDLSIDPNDKPRFERDIRPDRASLYNQFYCQKEERLNPYVSPLLWSCDKLIGFPKTLNILAGEDALCQEGEAFSAKLVTANVNVQTKVFSKSTHGFTVNRSDQHSEAFDLILSFLR